MARVLAIVLSTLFLLAVSVSAARSFEETGYIDMVTDKIQDLESNFVKILGTNPKSLQFAEFAVRYGKRYDSVHQLVHRFNVFVKNVELIESRNRMKLPYTLAINEFADITWEEFHGQYLGASQNCSATHSNHKLTYAQLPAKKDWRQEGIVSPVKNQAHCGSCWTFSTTGALEAAYTQATGKTVILSEQQLVDCAGAFNNFGCNGGLPSQAFEYIKYNGGLDTEEAYPYTAKDGVCKYDVNNVGATSYEKAVKEEKHHKQMEHLGELGAVAAGTFALYEKHKAKKDPENAHRHKIEEEIAATAAVGAGGYVFHEHHKKKEAKKEVKDHHF